MKRLYRGLAHVWQDHSHGDQQFCPYGVVHPAHSQDRISLCSFSIVVAVQLFALDKYSVKCTLRRKTLLTGFSNKHIKIGPLQIIVILSH